MLETARLCSAKLGIDRRQFLRTSGGMAAAFLALNSVFGELFTVDAAELWEPEAKPKKEYFVFDVQTHHVATGRVLEGPLGTEMSLVLTPTEYRLLYHLVQNAGWVVTHDQLLVKVWGYEYRDEPHYVRLYINYLRQKLEKDPANPKYILTERGVGYRFVDFKQK